MCLHPRPIPPVPAETARVARQAFPRGTAYLTLRDEFDTFFTDEQFAALFPSRGQPAETPWRLALVTLLQFAEGLSDRQAAEAVRRCIDWKYLLSLELTDPGFDASVLAEFRARLLEGAAETWLFERLLTLFRERQLLKARGVQRTDATHVLAAVRTLNRLETVGETLRHALNALAEVAPAWLRPRCRPEWFERYGRPFTDWRLPRGEAKRTALATQIGEDGAALLAALASEETPAALQELPEVATLRQVWEQQYRHEPASPTSPGARLRFRTERELPPSPERIQSPYDPDARYGEKRSTQWVGYKVHLTETCEPDTPLLITAVQTSAPLTLDSAVLPAIHQDLQRRDLLPSTHLVDAGYVEAAGLVESQTQYGVDLVGPALVDTSWQARAGAGFAAADFELDWPARRARCPQGKESTSWREKRQRGEEVVQVTWAREDCRGCASGPQCTRSTRSRRLTLRPEAEHRALQEARAREQTEGFAALYAQRAGVEGTLSQGVRRCDLRQSRYWGRRKVHLQQLLTAAAINLVRVADWLGGNPRTRTRRSALARLSATPA
jgi:transposase